MNFNMITYINLSHELFSNLNENHPGKRLFIHNIFVSVTYSVLLRRKKRTWNILKK